MELVQHHNIYLRRWSQRLCSGSLLHSIIGQDLWFLGGLPNDWSNQNAHIFWYPGKIFVNLVSYEPGKYKLQPFELSFHCHVSDSQKVTVSGLLEHYIMTLSKFSFCLCSPVFFSEFFAVRLIVAVTFSVVYFFVIICGFLHVFYTTIFKIFLEATKIYLFRLLDNPARPNHDILARFSCVFPSNQTEGARSHFSFSPPLFHSNIDSMVNFMCIAAPSEGGPHSRSNWGAVTLSVGDFPIGMDDLRVRDGGKLESDSDTYPLFGKVPKLRRANFKLFTQKFSQLSTLRLKWM